MAAVLDALAAPRRREILSLVWKRELAAGDIARAVPGVSFGAVSQHLGVLESAGLVSGRREGRYRFYAARRDALGPLGDWLDAMWDDALTRLKLHSESEEKRRGPRHRNRRLRRKERSSK